MMKRSVVLVLALVLGCACGANAALTLVGAPTAEIEVDEVLAVPVENTSAGAYSGWLEIADPKIADFAEPPAFTAAGNPGDASTVTHWPNYGAWYEFSVVSFPPNPGIAPGEHLRVSVVGVSEGLTYLNLYGSDGVTLLDQVAITVIPEPVTIALLGLGGLLLYRRR